MSESDIVIVGGSIIGSAVAYFLLRDEPGLRVTIVESDPTLQFAAAPRASGNIRQLWGLPENISMARYSRQFYIDFPDAMEVDGDKPTVGWRQEGYLWLAPEEERKLIERNQTRQRELGVASEILDPADVARMFPSLRTDDLQVCAWSPEDGWIDGYSAAMGINRKARRMGATFVKDKVVGFETTRTRVVSVELASGRDIKADIVVNASGAWASEIAGLLGMKLPVVPMRRMKFYFECPTKLEQLPAVRDFPRLTFRPEGKGFFAGVSSLSDPIGFNFDVDHDFFEESVWPACAGRVPAFETLRVKNSWAGHYEQNVLDTALIVGPWIGGYENFHVITGFSGNGLMHGPAAARGLSELILRGRFATIDLDRMTYRRVIDDKPLIENIAI
jgi:FAD-dependent oxidoreductase domain-containing protein 1